MANVWFLRYMATFVTLWGGVLEKRYLHGGWKMHALRLGNVAAHPSLSSRDDHRVGTSHSELNKSETFPLVLEI